MATLTKSSVFGRDLLNGAHRFSTDVVKVMLTNTAPTTTSFVKADITDIATGNGYAAGGQASAVQSVSYQAGTAKMTLTDTTFAATGGTVGPFRYAVVYNDTQTSPAKPLVGWYDYGSSISLNDGESVKVDFDDSNGFVTVA